MSVPVSVPVGESDCEALGAGFLVQPVNAVSSLAFVVVGVAIAVVSLHRRREVADSLVFAACVAAIGAGSFAYHGPQPAASDVLHDLPILIAVIFVVVHDAVLLGGRTAPRWWAFALATMAATLCAVFAPALLQAAIGMGVVILVGSEALIERRHLRSRSAAASRRLTVLLAGVGVLAAAAWAAGHTRSPVCDPDGQVQFHGVWHVAAAMFFGLWWWWAVGSAREARVDEGLECR